jgi:cobalamin synthase
MALLMLVLVRWQALSSMTVDAVPALGAALALGRSAVVGLAWIAPAATDGSGARFAAHLRSWIAVAVVAQAIAVAMWPGGRAPSFLLGGTIAIVLLARAYFSRRIGGITGGCLGATEQVVETWCLLVFACPPCTS